MTAIWSRHPSRRSASEPTSIPTSLAAIILLAAAGSTACADGDPGTVVVRDSAGIEVVENPARALELAARWTVSAEPSLRIGAVEGDSMLEFARIVDGVRLSDGRIVVADAGAGQVRAFDADGRFLWRQGGEGSGPGEYREIQELWRLPGDTVAVLDVSLRRIVVIGPEGRTARTVPVDAPILDRRNPTASAPMGAMGTRLVIPGRAPDRPSDEHTYSVHYLVDPSDGSADSLGVFRATPSVPVPGSTRAWPRFGWATHLAASDDALYMGTGEEYEVGEYDAEHQLRRLIRWTGPDRTITDEDRDEYLDLYVRRSRMPLSQAAALRADLERIPEADRKPAYFGLRTDRAGNLWVRDLDHAWMVVPDTVRWTVFDPDGRLMARAAMPGPVFPLDVGDDWVLARWRDAMDVQYVALFELVKGPEGGTS